MTSAVGFLIAAALLVGALLAGCGGVTANVTVTINPAKQYQRIAGFGVSEGFGQAKTLMNAPASVQKQVLSLLCSPTRGAGLTILRNEISADLRHPIMSVAHTRLRLAHPGAIRAAESGRRCGSWRRMRCLWLRVNNSAE